MIFAKSFFIGLIVLVLNLFIMSGCVEKDPLVKFMKKNNYTPYKLKRSDRGPGSVYRIIDKHNIIEVCEQLFIKPPITIADLTVLQNSEVYKIDNKFNSKLLSKFFNDTNDTDVSLKNNYYKNIEIKLKNLHEQKIVEENFYKEDGTQRDIVGRCRAALKAIQKNGQLKKVFMVYSTLNTNNLIYKLDKLYKNDSSLTLPKIRKFFDISSDLNISMENNETLTIKEPRNIGFKATEILNLYTLPAQYNITTVKKLGGGSSKSVVKKHVVTKRTIIKGKKIKNFDEFLQNTK